MNTKSISDKLLDKNISKKEKGLGKYSAMVNCIMGSVVTVMIILVFAFIQMMFKSGADGRRETFFGALYFDAQTLANGKVEINMGLANVVPIIVALAIVALLYYGIHAVFRKNEAKNI